MKGDRIAIDRLRAHVALGLVALALLLRILVPAGWMPAASGSGYAITLCTGMGSVSAWVDAEGKVHKEKPADASTGHPCVFSGFSAAIDLPVLDGGAIAHPLHVGTLLLPLATAVAIGRGLAAPPPPSTGPPASL